MYHCVKSGQIRSIFWSVFSRIRSEYGEIRSITPYSVQMRENMDQKILRIWILFTQCILLYEGLDKYFFGFTNINRDNPNENIPCRCIPVPPENLCQISWKIN